MNNWFAFALGVFVFRLYANTNGIVTDDVAVADLASYFELEQVCV